MLPFLHIIEDWVKEARDKSGFRLVAWPLFIAGVIVILAVYVITGGTFVEAVELALFLSPLWLPVLLVSAAWHLWVILRRSEYIAKQEYMLLEIKPPRDLVKTPLAMEAVFSGLHHSPFEGTWYKKYILGNVRPYWSLELASFEGQVHFFIWTRSNFRRLIETQIYAQYPGAQITEAPDYSRLISAEPHEWSVWGCDFNHTNPVDAYPIKTYVEYGLDKVQESPEQVDPLANLIEFMGSMGKGEYLWLQFVIRAHKGEKYHGKLNDAGKPYTWTDVAQEEIGKIRAATRDPFIDSQGNEQPGFPNPTKGQTEKIAAIERNISKQAFDVGMRGVYLADPAKFDPINITGLTGVFKQFSSEGWNGLKPTHWMTEFNDYPWEFRVEERKNAYRHHLVNAYRRRQFFHEPFEMDDYVVMSTEELATIYHIPSSAIQTPTLDRIPSATAEAPANLPT